MAVHEHDLPSYLIQQWLFGSFDLATEIEPGRWTISEKAKPTLKALGERNDIIKTVHRAKALAGDELGDRMIW